MKIHVQCPKCLNSGFIHVQEDTLKEVETGIIAVEIPRNLICEHFFVVYIDKNGDIRNYCIADFEIALDHKFDINSEIIEEIEKINVFLIKINIHPPILTYIVKSILLKKKILIISQNPILGVHIRKFFEYISRDVSCAG